MSEPTIQEALKQAGAPDYMVMIITEVVSAKDAIRSMQAELSSKAVEQKQREQLLDERFTAFLQAAQDMATFANQLYGPESTLSQINTKLAAAATRDAHLEKLVREVEDRVTVLERKSA